MAIQVRRGNEADFDPNKLLPGETATTLDTKKIFHAFAPGDIHQMATIEEMASAVNNAVDNATEDIQTEFTANVTAATNSANIAAQTATTAAQNADSKAQLADIAATRANAAAASAESIVTGSIATETTAGFVRGGGEVKVDPATGDISAPSKLEKTGDSKDNVVSFTEAAEDADIQSGENHTTIFGKILKSIKTFRAHINDTTKHKQSTGCTQTGTNANVEGKNNTASGDWSHSQGAYNTSSGLCSSSEGCNNTASGIYSHAGGSSSSSARDNSFVHGLGLIANGAEQMVAGRYNTPNTSDLLQVGNGTSDSNRNNALRLDADGNLFTSGDVMASGISGSVVADTRHTIEEHWNSFNVGVTLKSMRQSTCSYAFIGKTSNIYGAVLIMQYATPPIYGWINEGVWTWQTVTIS
jgi:hypothetical protein